MTDDTSPDTPVIAQKAPFPVDLVEGKTYFWCACGRSQKQPFCDGSHKATSITPVKLHRRGQQARLPLRLQAFGQRAVLRFLAQVSVKKPARHPSGRRVPC